MNIKTVKELENSYLVNDLLSVPKDFSNRTYRDVQLWIIDGGIVDPEFTYGQLLKKAKESKKEEVKTLRSSRFSEPLLVKNIEGKAYHAKTDPEINIFQSAILMGDNESRTWGCYCEGEKSLLDLTKQELVSLAHHYEERKNTAYNQCDLARKEIDSLSTIEEVEAFDINKVY